MKTRGFLIAVAASALLCTSCATMNESECRAADWRLLGYNDGREGQPTERYADRQQSCAEHRIESSELGWKLGYSEGLALYCTAPNGFEVGRRGDSYRNVCPALLDKEFRPAYEDGREIARRLSDLQSVTSRLDQIRNQLDQDEVLASRYIEQVRIARQRGETPPAPPQQLLTPYERDELKHEYSYRRRDYQGLRAELDDADGQLSELYQAPPLRYDDRY